MAEAMEKSKADVGDAEMEDEETEPSKTEKKAKKKRVSVCALVLHKSWVVVFILKYSQGLVRSGHLRCIGEGRT